MLLKIVQAPLAVLTTPAKKIAVIDKKILRLAKDMTDTLLACKDPLGVGLAAPQVGVSLALCLIKPTRKSPIEVLVNPVILNSSLKKTIPQSVLEGCLSIPNLWSHIKRSASIDVAYRTINGQDVQKHITGYAAHILQHEIDHLNGILFTQQALSQNQQLYTIKRKNGEEEFVPLEL